MSVSGATFEWCRLMPTSGVDTAVPRTALGVPMGARPSAGLTDRFSAHLSMLFRELPYLERPAAARDAGFSAVETWWPAELAQPLAEEVQRLNLTVALVNCFGGDIEAGERGFLNLPERRERTLREFQEAVELAQSVRAPRINMLAGLLTPDLTARRQLAEAASILRECAARVAHADITVVVEQINSVDVSSYLVPTAHEVVRLIDATGSSSVRMLYDVYHGARSGADPLKEVVEYMEVIDHIHYADCPGRVAPGTGKVDLSELLGVLDHAGYTGAVGLEYDPRGPTAPTLAFLGDR
jgi:hydroxypyruvate isomerase